MDRFGSVLVVVLNYRSERDTIECVRAIRGLVYSKLSLLVIDNASTEQSKNLLRTVLRDDEILALKKNTGYAGGNNIALKKAVCGGVDYVLIVNPDVRLSRYSVDAYVGAMADNPDAGALNPIQLDGDGTCVDEKFMSCVLRGWSDAHIQDVVEKGEEFEAETLFGACLMLSRSALERVGGFDPLFFAYGEERDLCRRIRFHGLKLLITPKAPVVHLRTNERHGYDDWRLFLRLKGATLYDLKDPARTFRVQVRKMLRRLRMGPDGNTTIFPFTRRHYNRTLRWILPRLPLIYLHKRKDMRGGPVYLRT